MASRDVWRRAVDVLFLPKEKRAIHAGNRNRDKFNCQEHAAHDGFWGGRREDEIHAEELRCLSRRSFPWRKEHGQNQNNDHSVEHRDVELLLCLAVGVGV